MASSKAPSSSPIPMLAVGCYGLAIVSTGMSGYFGWHLGSTQAASAVFLLMCVAADAFKVGSSIAFARLAARRSPWAALALAFVAGTTALSVAGGLGFIADQRERAGAAGEAVSGDAQRLRNAVERLETELAEIGTARPLPTIDADLAAARLNRRWRSTASCTNATVDASRQFCARVQGLIAERANRDRMNEIRAEMGRAEAAISAAERAATDVASSPRTQQDAIAAVVGLDSDDVGRILVIVMIIVIESGATFGIALLSRREQLRPLPRPARDIPTETPPAPATAAAPPSDVEEIPQPDAPPPPIAMPAELSATYAGLKRMANKDGVVTQGVRAIGAKVGRSGSTVSRHVEKLSNLGVITVDRSGPKLSIRLNQVA